MFSTFTGDRHQPHSWVVAQARYMLSRPWDLPLWSAWWWAGYVSTLSAMGIEWQKTPPGVWAQFWSESLDRAARSSR